MPLPLPQPRAMFAAALALAAAHATPVPAFALPRRLPPSGVSRRNVSLRRVMTQLGAGIVAAGRARDLFLLRGAMWAHPPLALKLDARAKAIASSAAVAALIGEVALFDNPEHAWVEASANHMTIFWRGEVSYGEGDWDLTACPDRFADACRAAADALDAAGFATSGLIDVGWLQISPKTHPGATRTFAGLVGSIHLKRRRPVWLLPQKRGASR